MILIVEHNQVLGALWQRHIARLCPMVRLCPGQEEAISALCLEPVKLLVLNLVLPSGSAIAVADFAAYRRPDAKVIFVTSSSFFSDGSLFQHVKNDCMMVPAAIAPEDLSLLAQHYAAPA